MKQSLCHSRVTKSDTRTTDRWEQKRKRGSRSVARLPSVAQQISLTTRPPQRYHRNTAIARKSSVHTDTTRSQTNIAIPHGGVERLLHASNEGNHETGSIDRSTIRKCYAFMCALHSRKWTRSIPSWDPLLPVRQTRRLAIWICSLPYTECSAGSHRYDNGSKN